jgi:hypothetical protein
VDQPLQEKRRSMASDRMTDESTVRDAAALDAAPPTPGPVSDQGADALRSPVARTDPGASGTGAVAREPQQEGELSRKGMSPPEPVPVMETEPIPPPEPVSREKKAADWGRRAEAYNVLPPTKGDADEERLLALGSIRQPSAIAPPCEGESLLAPREGEIVGCLNPRGPGAVRIDVASVGPIQVEPRREVTAPVPANRRTLNKHEATPVLVEEQAGTPLPVDRLDRALVPLSGPLPLPAWSPMEPWTSRLEVTVAADGSVEAAAPAGEETDPRAAALARVVLRWRFQDPIVEGQPVRVRTVIEVRLTPATP